MVEGRIGQRHGLDRAAEPVALTLPRIERHSAWVAGSIEPGRAAQITGGDMELRGDSRKRVAWRAIAVERRDHPASGLRSVQRIAQIGLQHRMGADFYEDPIAISDQRRCRLGKAHGVADVAPPMVRIERRQADAGSGDGGNQVADRRRGPDPREIGEDAIADRLHRRRMKGEIEIEDAAGDAAVRRLGAEPRDPLAITGNGHRAHAVNRRDFEPVRQVGEQPAGLGLAQRQHRHGPRPRIRS
jgi:hypothetical protein